MAIERLMARRALTTIIPPPGAALAVALGMTRKTGALLRLMPTEHDNDADLRDTMPPSKPITEAPPPGTSTLEEIAHAEDAPTESWAGYDESKFMHRATAAIINGTNALLKAKQEHDIEAIIQRQRVLFEETVSSKLDVVVQRVTKSEGDMRDLRTEFAAMKTRMAAIEAALGIKGTP